MGGTDSPYGSGNIRWQPTTTGLGPRDGMGIHAQNGARIGLEQSIQHGTDWNDRALELRGVLAT